MERYSFHSCSLAAGALLLGALSGWGGVARSQTDGTPAASSVVCGTPDVMERGRAVGGVFLYDPRPPNGTYIVGSTHFRVHYNYTLLSSYAQSILQAAEESFVALVDSLGCSVPPSDGTNGGDSRTDIYVIPANTAPYAGQTVPEEPKPTGAYTNAWTSFIEMVDTIPSGLIGVVTAHEFFHVIQLGYDKDEDIKFLEMISTWCEDYVFDDVNHYLVRLPAFFAQPHRPLMNWRYSNVLWAKFLEEKFQAEIVRDILHRCGLAPGGNSLEATDLELASRGSSLTASFSEFTLWNYFTGARDDGQHFEEALLYPLVWIERDVECLPLESYTTAHWPGPLACNYLTFLGEHGSSALRLEFNLDPAAEWVVSVTRFKGYTYSTDYNYYPQTVGWDPHLLVIDDWGGCDSLLVIPNVVRTTGTSFLYAVSASHPESTGVSPYVLVLDRDSCRRPFDGANDEFDWIDGEEMPITVALAERSVPFVLADSIPLDLSLCGAVFVVGGFDAGGINISDGELQTLLDFIDSGGDIYLESSEAGRFLDPDLAAPTPVQAAFWSRFGCSFSPGQAAADGNVSSWSTTSVLGSTVYAFDYDFMGEPDDSVGSLAPEPGADTLLVDQSGTVRGTVAHGPLESKRIYATVLLGGSTPAGPSGGRGAYLRAVLDLFDTIVPVLCVGDVEITVSGGQVEFRGRIDGYSGERVLLRRYTVEGAVRQLEMDIRGTQMGDGFAFRAVDEPGAGTFLYKLYALGSGRETVLWEDVVSVGTARAALYIYPNPSSGPFTVAYHSPVAGSGHLVVYDAAGRAVHRERLALSAGLNRVFLDPARWESPIAAGVYFVRVSGVSGWLARKLLLLR